ncbi:unnamed protein product [Ectocarpus sp. 8 AP-2014]
MHARLLPCRKTTTSFHTGGVFLPANTISQYATSSLALLANKSREYQGMKLTNKAPVRGRGGEGGGGVRGGKQLRAPGPVAAVTAQFARGGLFSKLSKILPCPAKLKRDLRKAVGYIFIIISIRALHSIPLHSKPRGHTGIKHPQPHPMPGVPRIDFRQRQQNTLMYP